MFPLKYLVIFFASTILALPGNPAALNAYPTTTSAPTQTFDCDYEYCDEKSVSWCFHFVPFTAIDPTKGPLPGETRTSIGVCGAKTVAPMPAY
ncbi:hypothetical protein ACHAPJ_004183 [Fusarium lateritium]